MSDSPTQKTSLGAASAAAPAPKPDQYRHEKREYVRFSDRERLMHAVMVVCFLTLAVTGMTLKFSFTPWASKISHFLGGFQTAGNIHRTAGVCLFLDFFFHLLNLKNKKNKKYKSWINMIFGENSMIPGPKDGREFIATMKWFLRMGPRPQYGRWTYWEKFDYFAVFWGVFVIGSTGLTLWFPVFFTRFLPGWSLNLATIIHSDEALLAAGFIFTVHFFNTHLRPEKFPMDTTVFTGHTKISELKWERPREYEELVATGTLEQHLAEPQPAEVVKIIRFFAWCALTVGFSVVIWIVYAMIFSYR
jgi:cytochrome b subunit of formate dehydrogenase